MNVKINAKNIDEVKDINQIVSKYPYEIWLHSKSGMVDAKSILGIFALSLDEDLYLVTEEDINTKQLVKDLSDYIVVNEKFEGYGEKVSA